MTKVTVLDLCFSERIPNVAVGYIVAALRAGGVDVEVISPLSLGLKGFARDSRDTWREHLERRVYFSTNPMVVRFHDQLHDLWRAKAHGRADPKLLDTIERHLSGGDTDLLMVTAYLDQYPSVKAIGEVAKRAGVPFLLGGPAFSQPRTVEAWRDIPGLTAIVGAEIDFVAGDIVRAAVGGSDLTDFAGVHLPDGASGGPNRPLTDLRALPIPDYVDFPWEKYAHRVAPIMTGRGCEWGKCLFCSDVTSVNGVGFRSRGWDSVEAELSQILERYDTNAAMFIDIKLNSDLSVWYGLHERYQTILPGGEWVGTVHVDRREDNGLSARALGAARAAGMVRISCGLETGSQRLNNRMAKNTDVGPLADFFRDAKTAGISTRTSMMLGFPGETAKDLEETLRFLDDNEPYIDRIQMSRFKAIPGTEFETQYNKKPDLFPGIGEITWDHRLARGRYEYRPARDRGYRRTKRRILDAVFAINSKRLPDDAMAFNGLM